MSTQIKELNLLEIRAVLIDMRVEAAGYRAMASAANNTNMKTVCIAEAVVLEHWVTRLEIALGIDPPSPDSL